MTPAEKEQLKEYREGIAAIFSNNTPSEKLENFEVIELARTRAYANRNRPSLSRFFFSKAAKTVTGRVRLVNSIVGRVKITSRQAQKLTLKKNTTLSPFVEKCCWLLVANESFKNAELDIEKLTGVKVSSSTQHRLVEKYELTQPVAKSRVEALSLDGGKVRVRTALGEPSQWRDYKAVSLHEDVCGAFFQNNQELVNWVNAQPHCRVITCVGDGHDGVWNLIKEIGVPSGRREVLDWFHLMENLPKIGTNSRQLKNLKNSLWLGDIESSLAELKTIRKSDSLNFQNYLNKHSCRIPDYSLYQQLNICIGSGSVESTIKRIGARIKIAGAQYLPENVPQYLKLRCAYLNEALI